MEYKPTFKSFLAKRMIANKEYLAYEDRYSKVLYKELNSFQTRIKYEVALCIIPIVMFAIYKVTSNIQVWQMSLINIQTILRLLVVLLLPLRFFFVKFMKITNLNEAKDCRGRIIEVILIIISIIMSNYVNNYIVVNSL